MKAVSLVASKFVQTDVFTILSVYVSSLFNMLKSPLKSIPGFT